MSRKQLSKVGVSVRVCIAVKRCHEHSNSYKEQHFIGIVLQVEKFSQLSSRWEHGNTQAGMVQEDLRVLHLHLKAARRRPASRELRCES